MNVKNVTNEKIIKEKMFHYFLNSLKRIEEAEFITEAVADMVEYNDIGNLVEINFINESSQLISVFIDKNKVEKIFKKILQERECQSPEELLFSTMTIRFVSEYEYFQDEMTSGRLVLVSVEDGYEDEDDSSDYEYDSNLAEICEAEDQSFIAQLIDCSVYDEGLYLKFQYTYDSRECFYEECLTIDAAENFFGCEHDFIVGFIGDEFIVQLGKFEYLRECGTYTKREYHIVSLQQ